MDRLQTPAAETFLTSPLGALVESGPFEALKTRSLPRAFAVRRARAAADVALGEGPAAYLRAVDAPPAPHLHDRIEAALAGYASRREAFEDATERWETAFWGDEEVTPDERVAAERERRRAAAAHAQPDDGFGFLPREHLVPPVAYDVPDPDDARERWAHELAEPERLYGFVEATVSEALPRVTRSRSVRGPGTLEYWLRFETPSLHVGDRTTARVYEPEDVDDDLPTLVFYSGLGAFGDLLSYWPEEGALGRRLARRGYRVVLPDAPWHGRREPLGRYSGEPYLARAPVSMFTLYAAAAKEAAVLVDWARTEGAPAVGVGGLSLGGTVALQVAGHCDHWVPSMRPDFVAPVGMPGAIDQTLTSSRLVDLLDLDDALAAAGWSGDRISEFAPLLNPPASPDLSADRVFAFYGGNDAMAPTATAETLLRRWRVPRQNVFEWDCGHFGTMVRLIRGDVYQRTVTGALDRFAEAAETATTSDDGPDAPTEATS
jgi:pimeloyl-ACP methyl ester carboxylesterase